MPDCLELNVADTRGVAHTNKIPVGIDTARFVVLLLDDLGGQGDARNRIVGDDVDELERLNRELPEEVTRAENLAGSQGDVEVAFAARVAGISSEAQVAIKDGAVWNEDARAPGAELGEELGVLGQRIHGEEGSVGEPEESGVVVNVVSLLDVRMQFVLKERQEVIGVWIVQPGDVLIHHRLILLRTV